MGIKIGYARVSTDEQDLTVQRDALNAYGCERIYAEKKSGTTTKGRNELESALRDLREGDEFVITRIDRCARSILDLREVVERVKNAGASFRATEQSIETETASGRCFLDMLAVFSEFETNLRRERQMEGIAKAKKKGIYKGRKATINADDVKSLRADGMSAISIAKQLNISRASVYRLSR